MNRGYYVLCKIVLLVNVARSSMGDDVSVSMERIGAICMIGTERLAKLMKAIETDIRFRRELSHSFFNLRNLYTFSHFPLRIRRIGQRINSRLFNDFSIFRGRR